MPAVSYDALAAGSHQETDGLVSHERFMAEQFGARKDEVGNAT